MDNEKIEKVREAFYSSGPVDNIIDLMAALKRAQGVIATSKDSSIFISGSGTPVNLNYDESSESWYLY